VTFYIRCLTSQSKGRVEPDWYWLPLGEKLHRVVVDAFGYDLKMSVVWLKDNGVLEIEKPVNQAASMGGEYLLVGTVRGVGAHRFVRAFEGLYVVKNQGILYRLGLLDGKSMLFKTGEMSERSMNSRGCSVRLY